MMLGRWFTSLLNNMSRSSQDKMDPPPLQNTKPLELSSVHRTFRPPRESTPTQVLFLVQNLLRNLEPDGNTVPYLIGVSAILPFAFQLLPYFVPLAYHQLPSQSVSSHLSLAVLRIITTYLDFSAPTSNEVKNNHAYPRYQR